MRIILAVAGHLTVVSRRFKWCSKNFIWLIWFRPPPPSPHPATDHGFCALSTCLARVRAETLSGSARPKRSRCAGVAVYRWGPEPAQTRSAAAAGRSGHDAPIVAVYGGPGAAQSTKNAGLDCSEPQLRRRRRTPLPPPHARHLCPPPPINAADERARRLQKTECCHPCAPTLPWSGR